MLKRLAFASASRSQRRFRNTLIFAAADEALLATAQEAMRRSLAWAEIAGDRRLQQEMTKGQAEDAEKNAKTSRDGAQKAVRTAWSHILFPIKTDGTEAGKAFDLDRLSMTTKDRVAIPTGVYDKARGDGIIKEKLGPEALWLHLKPLWPEDKLHLPVNEVAEWFATYVYLPKLRDRVVLDTAIRDAIGKLDPTFGYAESFDEASGNYLGLVWAKSAPELFGSSALLVRAGAVLDQLRRQEKPAQPERNPDDKDQVQPKEATLKSRPEAGPKKPRRFYGLVELDVGRPVKSFDAILNAVVMELQRTNSARVKLTLEIEAEAPDGFDDSEVGVVRDNARQLKFKAESTGFGD